MPIIIIVLPVASDIVVSHTVDEASLQARLFSKAPVQVSSYPSKTFQIQRVTKAQYATRERLKPVRLEPLVRLIMVNLFSVHLVQLSSFEKFIVVLSCKVCIMWCELI